MANFSKVTLPSSAVYDVKDAVSRNALVEVVDGGAKNLFPAFATQSSSTVVYSYSNGTVSASGTKSTNANYITIYNNKLLSDIGLSAGDTIVCSNDSSDLMVTIIFTDGTTADSAIVVKNTDKEITIPQGRTRFYLRSQINPTLTGTINLTSHPMICPKSLWDISQSFQPYRPSYQELYDGNLKSSSVNLTSKLSTSVVSTADSVFEITKYGKMCVARISLKISGTLTGSDVIVASTDFPAEYKPSFSIYQSVTARDTGAWTASTLSEASISVGSDGTITLRTGANASNVMYVIGTLTWLTN